jgi:hypothetical protein
LVVAAEVSVFPDPSDRLTAVLIFFGVEEDGAGTGAATFGGGDVAGGEKEDEGVGVVVAVAASADPRALGGEALASGEVAVFGGSSVSAGKRETNSWLVWLKSLGRLSPSFWMFSLVAFSALIMGGSDGRTAPAETAR